MTHDYDYDIQETFWQDCLDTMKRTHHDEEDIDFVKIVNHNWIDGKDLQITSNSFIAWAKTKQSDLKCFSNLYIVFKDGTYLSWERELEYDRVSTYHLWEFHDKIKKEKPSNLPISNVETLIFS